MIFDGYKIKIGVVVIGKKVVPIFVKGGEHTPPHVHVDVDKKFGLVEIKNGNLYRGNLTPKQLDVVSSWLKKNRKKAKEVWNSINPSLRLDSLSRMISTLEYRMAHVKRLRQSGGRTQLVKAMCQLARTLNMVTKLGG